MKLGINNWKEAVLFAMVVITIVCIGCFAVNQFLEFRYKAVWLSSPCDLCLDLNEEVTLCPKPTNLSFVPIR